MDRLEAILTSVPLPRTAVCLPQRDDCVRRWLTYLSGVQFWSRLPLLGHFSDMAQFLS